ncbi:MAG: hypothetical protein D6739_03845, partial [Nitrospirae bacterium]
MTLRLTPLTALVTAAGCGLVAALYLVLARGPEPLPTAAKPQGPAPAVVTDFTFTETRGAETRGSLKARRASYCERQNRVRVEEIEADLR